MSVVMYGYNIQMFAPGIGDSLARFLLVCLFI